MNKGNEKLILEYFKETIEGFPSGKIVASESPDFLIFSGQSEKIGIELVQLLPPPELNHYFAGILNPKNSYEQISMTINLKEAKRHLYQSAHCAELWLLIHFDFQDSPNFKLGNHISKWTFSHGFNRVYIFNLFERHVFEIAKR